MNRSMLAAPFALVALLIATPAPAQQFEGVVTMKSVNLTSDIVAEQTGEEEVTDRGREKLFAMTFDQLVAITGSANPTVMQVKGRHMRTGSFDMPGLGSAYMLLDVASGMMRTVAPGRRGYFEASVRPAPGAGQDETNPEIQVVPLGRTQVINGMRCTGYKVTEGDQISHVWTTEDPDAKQLFTDQLSMTGNDNEEGQGARAMLARYGAAILTQTFDEEGNFRVELWAFERKPLPDSLFAIPAGFTKMQMPRD